MGATLVNFHSSWRVVGNPSSANRAIAGIADRQKPIRAALGFDSLERFDVRVFLGCHFNHQTISLRRDSRFVLNPCVPAFLKLQRQLLAAALDDLSLDENVDEIGHDVVEQSLIVGHDQKRPVRIA